MEEDAFSAFERQGWDKLAQSYHAYYADLTIQSHAALLDALEVRAGVRFLDVASGPGYLAAAARDADVVGVDFPAAMVEQASRLYPALTFRVGSAEDLPFADDSFDAVGSGFRMHHFAHPEKALAEMFRVLRPGGRMARYRAAARIGAPANERHCCAATSPTKSQRWRCSCGPN